MIYWQLFHTFFIIGIFTFGGGYAMLSLIQNEVVVKHQWIDAQTFTDIVAISQTTPGPIGINSATYIGYTVTGNFWGSLTATLAVTLPSFIIVLVICRLYSKFRQSRLFATFLKSLRPVVIGMIAAGALLLITPGNFVDWTSWVLFAGTFIAGVRFKANPILSLIAAGCIGLIIY